MPIYVKHDLGHVDAGAVIEITPAQDANVYLVDAPNLARYRRGQTMQAVGGPMQAGVPVQLSVMQAGEWFVVADLGGVRGKIRASVRVLPPAEVDADITETLPARLTTEQLLRY